MKIFLLYYNIVLITAVVQVLFIAALDISIERVVEFEEKSEGI